LKVLKKHSILNKYFEIFPAIYGKTYNYKTEIKNNIVTKSWDYGSWLHKKSKTVDMTDGEIGVALSHFGIWKKIVKEKIPVTLVLEDDAIDMHPDFEMLVTTFYNHLPNDWDIFLLGFWMNRGIMGKQINKI